MFLKVSLNNTPVSPPLKMVTHTNSLFMAKNKSHKTKETRCHVCPLALYFSPAAWPRRLCSNYFMDDPGFWTRPSPKLDLVFWGVGETLTCLRKIL